MKKQISFYLFTCCMLLLSTAVTAQSSTFTAETIPFSIKLDQGWLATEFKEAKTLRIDKGEKNSRCFFLVEMETDSLSNTLTLEQYFENGFVNIYKRAGTEFMSGDTSIKKLKFLWVQRTTNSVRGYERFYVAKVQDKFCHIFCSASQEADFAELLKQVAHLRVNRK